MRRTIVSKDHLWHMKIARLEILIQNMNIEFGHYSNEVQMNLMRIFHGKTEIRSISTQWRIVELWKKSGNKYFFEISKLFIDFHNKFK